MKKSLLPLSFFLSLASVFGNIITTCPSTPVIALDTNAVCAGSVIDMSFFSYGVFNNNQYVAELSDISGNFTTPTILGSINSDITYDPGNPTPGYPPPGFIRGHIPDTISPGCNYYIRIRATSPSTVGTVWGPFCIQHSDIIINNEQDIQVCLYPVTTVNINIPVNINFYNNNAVYQPGNQFKVQLISKGPSPPPFTQTGSLGALGSVVAVNDTTLQLSVSPSIMSANGITSGTYYMRIVATNSSIGADSSFSTIVRITIGTPNATPYTITALDYLTFIPVDSVCSGDLVYFLLTPSPNPSSTFSWYSSQLATSPFVQPNLLVSTIGFAGNFIVYVEESNFGCGGPSSPMDTVYVRPIPSITLNVTNSTCSACCDGSITATSPGGFTYLWSNAATSQTNNNLCTGTYTVTVTDSTGCSATATATVGVGNCAATFSVYPNINTPHSYWAVNTSSGALPLSYLWSWGDATFDTAAFPTHTYASEGNHIITLTITDATGCANMQTYNSYFARMENANSMIYINVVPTLPAGLTTGELVSDISLFPNPATNELKIENSKLKIKKVEIYDAIGKLKLNYQLSIINYQLSIDISQLPSGIYFITVTDQAGNKVTKKVVKM